LFSISGISCKSSYCCVASRIADARASRKKKPHDTAFQIVENPPAPAVRTPERMKTIWLSRVAAFAAREQSERQTLRQLERVAVCHFSDTQKSRMMRLLSCIVT